jgi:putative glutathione S-transferase
MSEEAVVPLLETLDWRFTRHLYGLPGIAETVNLYHIKHRYYESHPTINPSGVVPLGPIIDFTMPAGGGADAT